jgi:hypothetical protein
VQTVRHTALSAAMLFFTGVSAYAAPLTAPAVLVVDAGLRQNSVDVTTKRVLAVSPANGAIINGNFLDLTLAPQNAPPLNPNFPIDVILVYNEFWVSDQNTSRIERYDLGGAYLGGFSDPNLVNVRGMEFLPAQREVLVCVAGPTGATSGSLLRFDAVTRAFKGSYPVDRNPWDVTLYNGELLVSSSATDRVKRYTLTGSFIADFYTDTTAFNFPYQISPKRSDGNVLIAAFSGFTNGVYEFSPAGVRTNYWQPGVGVRGVCELEDGFILVTESTGIRRYDTLFGGLSSISAASGRFANYFDPASVTQPPSSGCNPADIADNGSNPGSDGCVDNGDFSLFISQFFNSAIQAGCTGAPIPCAAADIADNGSNAGADGFLDNGDFSLFISSFFGANCTTTCNP